MSKRRRVKYLLSRSKEGLLKRAVFSRLAIFVPFLLLQIAILLAPLIWFREYSTHLLVSQFVVLMGAVFYLVNSRMDSTSKITWLIFIMLTPLLGTAFLIYTKFDFGFRSLKHQIRAMTLVGETYLKQDQAVLAELKEGHSTTYNLVNYFAQSDGRFPVYKNSRVQYYPLGEAKFEAMKETLKAAQHFIFLEYFIIEEGRMWGEILAILEEKAKAGVEVRVLYDGMNELSTLTFDYAQRLKDIGIQAKPFAPIKPVVSTHYNYRDHRKILVVDGKVAFTGGVNLADEYINQVERFGHWKDTAIKVEGPAVNSFTVMFLQMWYTLDSDPVFADYLLEDPVHYETEGYVIPYGDSPLDGDHVGENVYIDILNHARDYVYIMTPYLILDTELEHAIKFAAERGVAVKIIMPGIPDKKIPFAIAKTHYASLIDSGVEIYEYAPGFIHAKMFLADDIKAVVGTINLDYRSLYHHFECAAYLYKVDCLPDIKADFLDTFAKSELITHESLRKESLKTKTVGALAKVLAPLM